MKFQANVPFKLTKMFYEKLGEQPVNKRVLVIRDLFTAMHASIDNAVTFVTDDKEAYELFSKNVVSNDEFGNDDTTQFVDTEINKHALKDFVNELSSMPKFDVAIMMNKPYDGKLHLKILEKVIPIADKVVNISPNLWMSRRGSSEVTRFGNSVGKHIISEEYISSEEAHDIFPDTSSYMSLSILVCDNSEHNFDYKNYWKNSYTKSELSILNKITIKDHMLSDVKTCQNLNTKYCVLTAYIAGGRGNLPIYKYNGIVADGKDAITGKDWLNEWNANPKHKRFQKNKYECTNIVFDTLAEATNYYNSYSTKFMTWVCNRTVQQQHIKSKYIPYMQDYTQPWDDKRFCAHFGITGYIDDDNAVPNSEWETILNTIK